MSETLNVNVLVAAKEEYTKQFISTIQPGLYDIIKQIFTDSQKNNIRRIVSYSNFQKELKAVPNWANFKLEEKLNNINTKFPYLMDLVTAIFISHVKILACVRLKKDNKSVKIKVPNLNTFLHKTLINCSENIYYNPEIIDDNKNRIFEIINLSITETIANQIPIEYILNEYLSGAFDEEEPFYPENDDVVEQDEEPESSSDEEEPEEKNIPIIPIQKPISKKIEPGTLKDELLFNKPEKDEEQPTEIDDFNNLKDKKNEQFQINKQDEIEDDSEYSDDELSDEEHMDTKKEQKPSQTDQPTLF
tara:strand:+ start:630 stop:1541 length:912 start_codon:yes stop_codon:yes gene_type:complete